LIPVSEISRIWRFGEAEREDCYQREYHTEVRYTHVLGCHLHQEDEYDWNRPPDPVSVPD